MKVLIDTCVWSEVLRRKDLNNEFSQKLSVLISDMRVAIIGPIRQELLSGISDHKQFTKLKNHLDAFKDIALKTEHFIKAAEFSNICRVRGIQGSTIDFLICSVSVTENLLILTTDKDFDNYAQHLPINLVK
ncbi:MAG TPA: PIN domain nuclease [Lentisphaeria bacterium]|nr:MAG: twitching motility protein PilT [Lentisphaerae bacterium GWF2_38_69]HBM16093.1 PIN domain nuclease [Lentisphaeria bacterium]